MLEALLLDRLFRLPGRLNLTNGVGLEDLDGLSIVDFIVYPHYTVDVEEEIKHFEEKYAVSVVRINDSQAILVDEVERILV